MSRAPRTPKAFDVDPVAQANPFGDALDDLKRLLASPDAAAALGAATAPAAATEATETEATGTEAAGTEAAGTEAEGTEAATEGETTTSP